MPVLFRYGQNRSLRSEDILSTSKMRSVSVTKN